MKERPENFNAVEDDAEATLVAPRFDAEEARHAHPVVPLAEARTHAPYASPRPPAGRGLRRPWPPALLAVAPLAVAPVQASDAPAQTETPTAAEPPREVARTKPATRARRAEDARAPARV